jgi:hypothetical protein
MLYIYGDVPLPALTSMAPLDWPSILMIILSMLSSGPFWQGSASSVESLQEFKTTIIAIMIPISLIKFFFISFNFGLELFYGAYKL